MRQFTLTEDHLTLLQRARWLWNGDYGFGAVSIDGKYPFIDCGLVDNVCTILGWDYVDEDEDEAGAQEQAVKVKALYEELLEALEIVLHTRSFVPGVYQRAESRDARWEPVPL